MARAPVPTAVLDGPRGLGGWLLFFWIGITILKPLLEFASVSSSSPPISWMAVVGITCVCIATGVYIYREDPKALSLVKAYFIIELIFAQLFFIEAWSDYRAGSELIVPHAPLLRALRMVGYVVIWWWYFRVSVRVRNTFGRNA